MFTYRCIRCNKEKSQRGFNVKRAKYCSFKCKWEDQKGKFPERLKLYVQKHRTSDTICKLCKKIFHTYPSNLKRRKGIYCSNDCRFKDKEYLESIRGKNSPSWKGGKRILSGYIYILNRDHPYRNSQNRIAEHRLIMESKLKRYLTKNEEVHHIDGDKTNNKIDNLELVIKKAHFGKIKCPYCLKEFKIK